MIRLMLGVLMALLALSGVAHAQPAYDADGWVRDLGVVREAVGARYANLQWAVEEREADLPARFATAERLLREAENDTEARRVFERLAEGLGDGHVEFRWPARAVQAAPAPAASPAARPTPCDSIGVRAIPDRGSLAARMPGWREVAPREAAFAAGVLPIAGRTVGVVRIPLFMPTSRPELCQAAMARLSLTSESACDDNCRRRLSDALTALYTEAFADTLRRLRTASAEVLLVDLTNNGGGSEWAEAAARMVTPVRLRSARLAVIRHPHWREQLRMRLADLDIALSSMPASERPPFQRQRTELLAMQAEIGRPCDTAGVWRGEPLACSPTVSGPLYATGLTDSDDSRWRGQPWAANLFDPAKIPFTTGVWSGPLVVAVDGNTASAAEQFAAILQDGRAATIVGSPTHGSGCGFVNGGVPTPLPHSGGTLMLPDCARLRADASNEVAGITPDVLVPFRRFQGVGRRAAVLQAALPAAVEQAVGR